MKVVAGEQEVLVLGVLRGAGKRGRGRRRGSVIGSVF